MGKDYSLSVVKGGWWDYQNQFWQGQCLPLTYAMLLRETARENLVEDMKVLL